MKVVLITLLLVASGMCFAAPTNYVFEAVVTNDATTSSWGPVNVATLERLRQVNGHRRYRVFVTKAQYDAGWTALPTGVKAAQKAQALSVDEDMTNQMAKVRYDKWTPQERYLFLVTIKIARTLAPSASPAQIWTAMQGVWVEAQKDFADIDWTKIK